MMVRPELIIDSNSLWLNKKGKSSQESQPSVDIGETRLTSGFPDVIADWFGVNQLCYHKEPAQISQEVVV